jgi:hypothetical protein
MSGTAWEGVQVISASTPHVSSFDFESPNSIDDFREFS